MEREQFINSFSKRLNSLLEKQGHVSTRSRSGVGINQLAKAAGVSYQMARKYSLGLALPDLHTIPKIAKWLNIPASWLLFGDEEEMTCISKTATTIEIENDLLKYIIQKCMILLPPMQEPDKIAHYIYTVIYDATHINADRETIIKIIDMMLSSAMQLNGINQNRA